MLSGFDWFILICQLIIQLAHDVENENYIMQYWIMQ